MVKKLGKMRKIEKYSIISIMSRQKSYQNQVYTPKRCWVGDAHKICYDTREEAEAAALVAEYDHQTEKLGVYKCEYGEHWHLTSLKNATK